MRRRENDDYLKINRLQFLSPQRLGCISSMTEKHPSSWELKETEACWSFEPMAMRPDDLRKENEAVGGKPLILGV